MFAVINQLPLGKPIDPDLCRRFESELVAQARAHRDFIAMHLVSASEKEAIIVVLFKTREGLDEVSSSIAAPWFAKNVRPYLSGPVSRTVGEVVASSFEDREQPSHHVS